MFSDTVDKIVGTYFFGVARETFSYKGKHYTPKPLTVSTDVFRGFTCPSGCGACCPRFSLDYLPSEKRPAEAKMRPIEFSGKNYAIFSDTQTDHNDKHCRNLMTDGRCGIHTYNPFSCDFELLRFTHWEDKTALSCRLYGRAWALLQVDNVTRGAQCEMLPPTPESVADTIRKLERLQAWTTHFGLVTWLPEIIAWARTGPTYNLTLTTNPKHGFFT